MPEPTRRPILFIGAGNMATAIAAGAQRSGMLDPSDVAACALRPGPRESYSDVFDTPEGGMDWLRSREKTLGDGVILLAVKPQKLKEVGAAWSDIDLSGRLIISVLAGVTGVRIAAVMGGRVVRTMPNTPSAIGQGCSAVAASEGATPDDVAFATRLFGSVGRSFEMPEDLIDGFTGVAGSGPAYVFYLAEAMSAGAREAGLSEDQIGPIVSQTLYGAASMLAQSSDSPETLRARVTSKNGTTFAATSTFDREGVMEAVRAGVLAARDRGRELAQESNAQ